MLYGIVDRVLYKLLAETNSCVKSVRVVKKMDQKSGNKKRLLQIILSTFILVGVTSGFVILGALGE